MWPGGFTDWIVLGSGYLLALGLFYRLGGIQRAGDAMRDLGPGEDADRLRRREEE